MMPQMEAPPELLMPLLPYQKEFLAWAIKQEQGDVRGGCALLSCRALLLRVQLPVDTEDLCLCNISVTLKH